MAEKKKKIKPFKTAAGAQQFVRNFDLKNISVSTQAEIDKMENIFEKEHKKLGNDKFKEKYAGKTINQVRALLNAMKNAQIAKGFKERYGDDKDAKMFDQFEKRNLELEKKLGKIEKENQKKKGKTRKAKGGMIDYRKGGLAYKTVDTGMYRKK
tara:strand:- start:371 stop:832 length:462 start_codon:yes stop_codon:yes gene_type:complete